MARKNPFANLMDDKPDADLRPRLDYTIKGASKSILHSIDEMAERADRLLEGQTVAEIDPALVDVSFVRDRLSGDDAEYQELLAAIREHGQQSPVLLRPHPRQSGRYMVVFGHRRVRAAAELGIKVRAIVREMDDRAHVVAQGQENSARANLSFIEKAMFAGNLSRLNYDQDNATVRAALSVDRATLSKLLSVSAIPAEILAAVGPARGIGRDRWYELKILLEKTAVLDRALDYVADPEFLAETDSDNRFHRLVAHLKAARKPARAPAKAVSRKWSSEDKRLSVDMKSDGKNFTLALKAKDAMGFGEYVSRNLAALYETYRRESEG